MAKTNGRSRGRTDHNVRRKNEHKARRRSNGQVKATNLTPQDKRYITQYGSKLSPATKRAKWINRPNEKEDRPGQTLATRRHDVIKHWADERKAAPATVPGTEYGNTLGVLRMDFRGYGGGSLEKVNWQTWFNTFDKRKLTFVFQEHKRDGHMSNFFKLDSPMREHS